MDTLLKAAKRLEYTTLLKDFSYAEANHDMISNNIRMKIRKKIDELITGDPESLAFLIKHGNIGDLAFLAAFTLNDVLFAILEERLKETSVPHETFKYLTSWLNSEHLAQSYKRVGSRWLLRWYYNGYVFFNETSESDSDSLNLE